MKFNQCISDTILKLRNPSVIRLQIEFGIHISSISNQLSESCLQSITLVEFNSKSPIRETNYCDGMKDVSRVR